jgi:ParB family chromosome partitioning protein
MKTTGLGKGLSALISDQVSGNSSITEGYIPNMPIDIIIPNPYQPRMQILDSSIEELAASIKEHGIIEPLLVTKSNKITNQYELIAGERRWRASKLAGKTTVPVVVKESSPQEMLELAILENIQRADLNPLEEGMAYDQLVKEFSLSHDQIAKKMGVSRPAIANKIRLLQLPEELKKGLLDGKISEGHARALLGSTSQENMFAVYKSIIRDNLSVRGVEELVRRMNQGKNIKVKRHMRILDERTTLLETNLRQKFGEKVALSRSKKGGKITIPFTSDDELDKIMNKLI